jgi:hypothetical protein
MNDEIKDRPDEPSEHATKLRRTQTRDEGSKIPVPKRRDLMDTFRRIITGAKRKP